MRAQKIAIIFGLLVYPLTSMARSISHNRKAVLNAVGIGVHTEAPNDDVTRQQQKGAEIQIDVANEMADLQAQLRIIKGKYGDTPVFKERADPKNPDKKMTPTPQNPLPFEMNYKDIFKNDELTNEFFNKGENEKGSTNTVQGIPAECKSFTDKNPGGITFVQPSNVNELGAVLFNGQSCSGVKRRDGKFNNWPNSAINGQAKMTPNGVSAKNSDNFTQGDYGPFPPIWLGDGGAVQIHSLNRLEGNKSLAGVSSMGCLVVNQDCMQAINAFIAGQTNLNFTIIPDSTSNNPCTQAVNKAQSI